jgi:hypothetical protein
MMSGDRMNFLGRTTLLASMRVWLTPRIVCFIALIILTNCGVVARSAEEDSLMESDSTSQVAQMLDVVLKEQRFVRSGLNWYRYDDESVLVVNVQRANFAPGPYINLGVYFYRYGDLEEPQIVDCHVHVRLTRVVPNAFREIELLDLTNDMPTNLRRDGLEGLLRTSAIPWLETLAKFDSARSFLTGNPTAAYVSPNARTDLLQTSSE